MPRCCFISYKKEDEKFKNRIIKKLGQERIPGKSLDVWIESNNMDFIMQQIRDMYMKGTSVTIFLIGEHSSELEGLDSTGRNKQAYIIRELQATLFDKKGNPRDGLLGVVLPSIEEKVFLGKKKVNISDDTVIREFSENYWLKKNEDGLFNEDGRYCVLCRYCDFMRDPESFIEKAYLKRKQPIAKMVHYKDIKHKGM